MQLVSLKIFSLNVCFFLRVLQVSLRCVEEKACARNEF